MKPHESPRINKKSIRGNSGDSWPVWNRGIKEYVSMGRIEFLAFAFSLISSPFVVFLDVFNWLVFYRCTVYKCVITAILIGSFGFG